MQLWEIDARLKIRAAIDKNSYLYDSDQFVAAYSVYTEDCVLTPHPPQRVLRGRAAILERFTHREDGRLGSYGYARHNVSTHYVTSLTPTHAEAYTYYFVFVDGPIGTAGRYHDDFVCIDGEWLIAHRRVLQDLTVVPPSAHLLAAAGEDE